MTPREFVIWLRGFTQAANNFTLTPKQWDDMKEKLNQVDVDGDNLKATRYLLDSSNWERTTITSDRMDITNGTGKELLTETQQTV